MFYDRKIKYLDYLVKGERCGNAGFMKLEVRDTICNITINVNGLRTTDSLPVKFYLVGAGQERELCTLELAQGRAAKQLPGQNAQNLGDTGIAYNSLESVRIPISAEREIVGIIGTVVSVGQVDRKTERMVGADAMTDDMADTIASTIAGSMISAAEISAAAELEAKAVTEKAFVSEKAVVPQKAFVSEKAAVPQKAFVTEETAVSEKEFVSEKAVVSEKAFVTEEAVVPQKVFVLEKTVVPKKAAMSEKAFVPEKLPEQMESVGETEWQTMPVERDEPAAQSAVPKKAAENKEKKVPLCDNKWKQLWEIYPHITPFRDEREYLSVGPNDFVILPEKYFRMANNSFLLHGYYNYKHLVLKRLVYRGEVRYYIGVPGNFYDREKQVAIMFGFESFESQEEPSRAGDYGYYLMRIEL